MERMYQRNKIQEESLQYEHSKHTGELPIIGVNTFLSPDGSPTIIPSEVIRSTNEEKDQQIYNVNSFQKSHLPQGMDALENLKQVSRKQENTFASLMEAGKYCTLGSISHTLYQVGGQYRRSM